MAEDVAHQPEPTVPPADSAGSLDRILFLVAAGGFVLLGLFGLLALLYLAVAVLAGGW